jgi:hypothetical protein
LISDVNMGNICLTYPVKIDYNSDMSGNVLSFFVRIILILALWAFIWGFLKPRTQIMRVLRAALILLGMLAILAVVRFTGL